MASYIMLILAFCLGVAAWRRCIKNGADRSWFVRNWIGAFWFSICLVVGIFVAGTASAATTLKARQVIEAFEAAKLPITNLSTLTSATDPNQLLGRPSQYIEKIDFEDGDVDAKGTLETFRTAQDLDARYRYIDRVTKSMPMLAQYLVKHKNVLIRFDKGFTPEQVAEYASVLKKL